VSAYALLGYLGITKRRYNRLVAISQNKIFSAKLLIFAVLDFVVAAPSWALGDAARSILLACMRCDVAAGTWLMGYRPVLGRCSQNTHHRVPASTCSLSHQ
jgi:hypothetical protein